jgi:hypothetical protein
MRNLITFFKTADCNLYFALCVALWLLFSIANGAMEFAVYNSLFGGNLFYTGLIVVVFEFTLLTLFIISVPSYKSGLQVTIKGNVIPIFHITIGLSFCVTGFNWWMADTMASLLNPGQSIMFAATIKLLTAVRFLTELGTAYFYKNKIQNEVLVLPTSSNRDNVVDFNIAE